MTRGHLNANGPTGGIFAAMALLGTAAVVGAVLLARRPHGELATLEPVPSRLEPAHGRIPIAPSPTVDSQHAARAARRLNRAAGLIATSVLLDSAVEHYRGAFSNKAMYTPIVVSALVLAASFHGHRDRGQQAHMVRDGIYALAGLTGIAGTGFHIYNVGKRVGGFSWQNLFYAAPLGAPAAISLAGMVGFLAERVRNNEPGTLPLVAGLPAGRVVGLLTSLGLLGTVGEAGLLHFRGAYHNPAMLIPVTLPPAAAAFLATAALGPAQQARPITRWWLRVTALIGVLGVGFHAVGVARNMGGWRNWTQNLQVGPPLPAPPAFTGLALAGLAALGLLQDQPDD